MKVHFRVKETFPLSHTICKCKQKGLQSDDCPFYVAAIWEYFNFRTLNFKIYKVRQ